MLPLSIRFSCFAMLATLIACLFYALFSASYAFAAPAPQTLGYQGSLSQSGVPVNGPQSMVFSLYDAASGGNLLWTESQPAVQFTDGSFSVVLGSVTSIPPSVFSQAFYLEVQIGATVLSPRQTMNSVPYAHVAFGVLATSSAPTSPTGGLMYFNSTTGKLFVYNSVTSSWVDLSTSTFSTLAVNSSTATSTVGSGGFAIDNNKFIVQQGSGKVGIGTLNPSNQLHVVGVNSAAARFDRSSTSTFTGFPSGAVRLMNMENTTLNNYSALSFGTLDSGGAMQLPAGISAVFTGRTASAASADLVFSTADATANNTFALEAMRITASKNVGIGTTTPFYKLSVGGTFGATGTSTLATTSVTALTTRDFFAIGTTTLATTSVSALTIDSLSGFLVASSGVVSATSAPSLYTFSLTATTSTSTISSGGFSIDTNKFIVQQGSGRVGMGTLNPTNQLHVVGINSAAARFDRDSSSTFSGFPSGAVRLMNNDNTTLNNYSALSFGTNDSNGAVQLPAGISAVFTRRSSSAVSADLVFSTANSAAINSFAVEAMRITSEKNVGIGSTTPFYKLGVAGTFGATGTSTLATTSVTSLSARDFVATGTTTLGTTSVSWLTAIIFSTTGTSTLATTSISALAASGVSVSDALTVSGTTTLGTTTSNWLNAIEFLATGTSTLATTSATSLSAGDVTVSNSFTVTGNTTLATTSATAVNTGDLSVSGTSTLTNVSVSYATLQNGLTLSTSSPVTTTNTLYNVNGSLYFNGSQLGAGGGGSGSEWQMFNDSAIRLSTTSNTVLIGASATSTGATLEVAGSASVSSGLSVSGDTNLSTTSISTLVLGSLSGFLTSVGGVVQTALVNLGTDVTGILPVANGGTGAASLTGLVFGSGAIALDATTSSSGLANIITDGTGSGSLVFANAPTLANAVIQNSAQVNGTLDVSGNTTLHGTLDLVSNRISNLSSPVFSNDAANKSYVDAFVQGLSWKAPVIAFATTSVASSTGDRYIVSVGADGFGSCSQNNIAENSGSFNWQCTTIATGTTAYVNQLGQSFTFNGVEWVSLGASIAHNSLNDIEGGDGVHFFHLGLSDYSALTSGSAQLSQLQKTGSPQFMNATITSATSSNLYTTGFGASSGTIGSLVSGGATSTTGYISLLTAQNATTSILFSTTASSSNLFAQQSNLGSATAASLSVQGVSALGSVNASGVSISQNGLTLSSSTPLLTANTLYSQGSLLYWNGSPVNTGSQLNGSLGQFAYFNGTNSAVGTSSLYLASSGNVGIGTTNPNAKLAVDSGVSGTAGLQFAQLTNASASANNSSGKVLSVDSSGNVILVNDATSSSSSSATGADVIATKSTALTSTLSSTPQIVKFNSTSVNTNNAYATSTGVYTAPTTGDYQVNAILQFTWPAAGAPSTNACIVIRKQSSVVLESCDGDSNDVNGGTVRRSLNISGVVSLTAGQTIDITSYLAGGTAPTFITTANTNALVIKQLSGMSNQPTAAFSSLTSANAASAIDNTSFSQTWDWSQITTGDALTVDGNSLTSGSLLKLLSSNSSLNSSKGILDVENTGSSVNGRLATFAASSTASRGMFILNNGNVGIGTATPSYALDVLATSTNIAHFAGANNTSCTISSSGTISCSSDSTLKHDITPLAATGTLDKILALNPVSFVWNGGESLGAQYGFIAQDVQQVFPTLVSTDTDSGKLSLNQIGIIPFIVKALQEEQTQLSSVIHGTFDSIVATVIHSDEIHTKKLCVSVSDTEEVCLTPDQIRSLGAAAQPTTNGNPSPEGTSSSTDATSTTATSSDATTTTTAAPSAGDQTATETPPADSGN